MRNEIVFSSPDHSLNVAFICKQYDKNLTDGVSVYNANLIKSLKNEGVNIHEIRANRGILGIWPFYTFLSYRNIRSLADQRRINIIHSAMGDSVISSKIRNCPYVLTIHGALAAEIAQENSLSLALSQKRFDQFCIYKILIEAEKISANNADVVISPSEFAKQKAIEYYSIPSNKVVVIPHGININHFAPKITFPEEKNKSVITLLFIGSLRPLKGVIYLIKATELLSSRYRLQLRIVGDGPERSFLETYCALRKIKNVQFLGRIPNNYIGHEIAKCDIFCFPSLHEGFGIVILEAMALKKPVVATSVGAIPEIIQNNKNGILVPPKNEKKLAEAIEVLIIDTDLRIRMGLKGYETAVMYNWERAARKVVKVYESLI